MRSLFFWFVYLTLDDVYKVNAVFIVILDRTKKTTQILGNLPYVYGKYPLTPSMSPPYYLHFSNKSETLHSSKEFQLQAIHIRTSILKGRPWILKFETFA